MSRVLSELSGGGRTERCALSEEMSRLRHLRRFYHHRRVSGNTKTTGGVGPIPFIGTVHPFIMPALSPDVGAHLLKATRSNDFDEAFEKVLSEYLELKIAALQETTDRLEEKWGMEFTAFKRRLAEEELPDDAYSYDVEQDFWDWEEAESLKTHYQQVRSEWSENFSGRSCTENRSFPH